MQILVACEESQAVTIALRKLGHEAYSCDLIPCSGGHPEWHIQQDVLPLLNGYCFFKTCDGSAHYVLGRWDMLIAFPPCTYLTNASAVRMRVKGEIVAERYAKAMEAKAFFMSFLSADCAKIAVENPTPLKIVELPPYTQAIQPWQFGHPYTKRTCLWLKELPLLVPTEIITEGVTPWVSGTMGRARDYLIISPPRCLRRRGVGGTHEIHCIVLLWQGQPGHGAHAHRAWSAAG